jgi:hypothetical protein
VCYVARFIARRFGLILDLFSVLRRTLRRATIQFNFRLSSVLCRALRRATIHSIFRLSNRLRRTLRRTTIYFNLISDILVCCVACLVAWRSIFKFNLSDVCCRALRRVMLDVIFIINSSVSLRAPSRDDLFFSPFRFICAVVRFAARQPFLNLP